MTKQRNFLFFWQNATRVFPDFATLESRSTKTERDEYHYVLIKKRKLKSSHQRENDLGDEVRLIWILRRRTFKNFLATPLQNHFLGETRLNMSIF